jgi:acyl-CoA synthetase (AMP-forming)/AMP-acid ligase II
MRRIAYRELGDLSLGVRQLLRSHGVGPRDAVAYVLRNGPETAALFLALASYCQVAPINPNYQAAEIEFVLRDIGASALITTEDLPKTGIAARDCGIGLIWLSPRQSTLFELHTDMPVAGIRTDDVEAGPEDIALLLHTSGTTARPKLVGLTHRSLCLSSRAVARVLRLAPEDRCLSLMPLFHIHGLVAGLLSSISAGASVCCAPGFQAMNFFSWMKTSRPTWYTAVPAIHQAILSRAARNQDVLASHGLRFVRSSSSPLHASIWSQLESTFQVPALNAYGMTEAAHQISSVPLFGCPSRDSVGFTSGLEIAVLGSDGVVSSQGGPGEIVLRGDQVIHAYLNPVSANEQAFQDGWFRTGDEGVITAGGELRLTGRLKEMINAGGEKVAPAEIDAVLLLHPAVSQAMTFGVPCPTRGESVHAAVVLQAPVEERDLRIFVRDRLARFKVPERILILDEIPTGPTGKPQRIGMARRLGIG